MALQSTAGPGIDTDIDLNFEAGLATRVDKVSRAAGGGLVLGFHS
jgi:hypothetical protein